MKSEQKSKPSGTQVKFPPLNPDGPWDIFPETLLEALNLTSGILESESQWEMELLEPSHINYIFRDMENLEKAELIYDDKTRPLSYCVSRETGDFPFHRYLAVQKRQS